MPQPPVVLVTGGAKGVGRGISERFLASGATVIACGRERPESLPQAAERRAEFITADLRDEQARIALLAQLIERHGRLDVLVNNAGGSPFAMADQASPRFHDKILQLNLLAPLHLAQLANAQMQKQGSGAIVFIASVSGLRPSPGTAAYGAAKAAVLSLVQSLAIEWAPKVRVVAVTPGPVLTEQADLHYGDASGIAAVASTIPLQRLAQPNDIGDACVWLASPAASYVSGSNLLLHGGGERPAFLAAATANRDAGGGRKP
ncbi:SDR family oxidoreductase [Hydrocarboniphaga effusa]|uniref:SDR family oxidoreductase n=1 Tax=Hydrocarboniphaga effusa TaxID=243629 RepID=UPI003137C54B